MPLLAVAVDPQGGFFAGILAGVAKALPDSWSLVPAAPGNLAGLRPDAVLFSLDRPEHVRQVRVCRCPAINLSSYGGGFPQVLSDQREIGRQAARHLREQGCTTLAWVGVVGGYAVERRRGFIEATDVPVHEAPERELGPWLARLPAGTGVLAANDRRAVEVLGLLARAGRSVPSEVAVVGVDDDALLTALARPTLSSIPQDLAGLGACAANLIVRGVRGPAVHRILPRPLVIRASSDRTADPVARATAYLLAHLDQPVAMDAVAAAAGLPRRTCDARFRAHHGMSMQEWLHRGRVSRAETLLAADADLSLAACASRCGFASAHRLIAAFRTYRGTTPRRRLRRA